MKLSSNISKNWFGGLFVALAVIILAFSCTSAQADDLFNNGAPQVSGVHAAGFLADAGYNFDEAGNVFTPTESGTVDDINFAGYYFLDQSGTPTTDSFTVSLYATSSDQPTTLIATSALSGLVRTGLGSSSDGYTIYSFTGSLATPLTISSSDTYYLGITDATNPTEDFTVDDTASPGLSNIEKSFDVSAGTFIGGDGFISFDLVGTAAVPEPFTWALLLGGLGLLAFWRTRTRQAVS
jgi:MYXO-CTERM domain-containing protein